MYRGYVKLWRKMSEWEWYNDLQFVGFFIHLVLEANHKESRYMGHTIPRGSLVFGRKVASKRFNVGERTVRTWLTRLKATSEVTIQTTNRFSIISIVKYADYQDKATNKTTTQQSHNRPATDQQPTTSKECKNEKKIINKSKFGEFKNVLLTEKELNLLGERFSSHGASKWIKTLDEGIELKGYKYKNHYLAILKWAEKEAKDGTAKRSAFEGCKN